MELDGTEPSVRAERPEPSVPMPSSNPTLPDRLASSLGVGLREIVGIRMRLELRGFVRLVCRRHVTGPV